MRFRTQVQKGDDAKTCFAERTTITLLQLTKLWIALDVRISGSRVAGQRLPWVLIWIYCGDCEEDKSERHGDHDKGNGDGDDGADRAAVSDHGRTGDVQQQGAREAPRPKEPPRDADSGVWFVEFYAPWCGHCKNLAPEWKKAAKALEGVVNVAAVDCDQHKELAAQFGVQGFPTIKVFGENKKSPTDYQGQRTAQGIVDAAIAETRKIVKSRLSGGASKKSSSSSSSNKKKPSSSSKGSQNPKTDVVTLTDSNFDDLVLNSGDVWLVEFYAPWCGHCKALAPEWEQAASDLKGVVKLGALDATAHEKKAAEYGIRGFPTIKVFGSTASSADDAQDYQGARTASGITSYALQALEKMGGGLKIKELYSTDVLTDFCSGKSSCVIAVLPHLTESGKSGREGYLSALEEAAKLVRGKPFKFGWIQGGDQLDFEKRFELTFGYPSVVAINLDRKRYVVQRGAFSAQSIETFLQGVLQGKEATVGFDEFPKLKTVEPWNGEDAKVEVIEDEDDDDILSEILGAGANKDEL